MRKLRPLLAVITLPLLFAATAAATTVNHGVRQVDVTRLAPVLSNGCGFPLYVHEVGTVRFNNFLDDDGLIVKQIAEENFSETITNPATGKTATAHRRFVAITIGQDLFGPNQVVYSQTLTGADWAPITMPGLGATAQATGILVRVGGLVAFEGGPHDFIDGNADVFCDYMADP
jgi:hypothetical protein